MTTNSPSLNGPYLTASALYHAGFRGWPIVVLTAIAGRESGWDPTASEVDTNGIYSTSLWQINSDSGVQQLKDPLYAAKTVFGMAGGNQLSDLTPWALANDPASGVVPNPIYGGYNEGGVWHPHDYTIAPWIPAAQAAYAELQRFGPASVEQIRSQQGWSSAGTATLTGTSKGSGSGSGSGSSGSSWWDQALGWLGDAGLGAFGLNLGGLLSGGGGSLGAALSLPQAVTAIAGGIAALPGKLEDLFKALAWIVDPVHWLRIFCGIAGFLLTVGGGVALTGVV